jgi:hypothetical protein
MYVKATVCWVRETGFGIQEEMGGGAMWFTMRYSSIRLQNHACKNEKRGGKE